MSGPDGPDGGFPPVPGQRPGPAGADPETGPGSATSTHLPQRVAEIAGQMSEAPDESGRRSLARQLPRLTSGSQTAARGLAAGAGAAWRGARTGAGAAVAGASGLLRRARPAADVAARTAATSRDVAVRGAQVTGQGARAGGVAAWHGLQVSGQWLTEQALDMAPRIPMRTADTIRAQNPGLDTEQLADRLISGAARASAGVGMAVGATAAVPFVPTLPIELGVETLALVAIEVKLIAELHEIYGMRAEGTTAQRMRAYLAAWSQRRGVHMAGKTVSVTSGSPLQRQIERALLKRASESAISLAPLFAGAAVGAVIDHRDTRRLGATIREDLRKRSAQAGGADKDDEDKALDGAGPRDAVTGGQERKALDSGHPAVPQQAPSGLPGDGQADRSPGT